MEKSDSGSTDVAFVRADSPKDALKKGFDLLGGLSSIIEEGNTVFIKSNLLLPEGFPTNINMNLLGHLINSCKLAGARKINVACVPLEKMSMELISETFNLETLLREYGAELLFLDDEESTPQTSIAVNSKNFMVPKALIDCDKFIVLNQVNVAPLFNCTLSLLNSYSLIPNSQQRIDNGEMSDEDHIRSDHYKKKLLSNMIDVLSIRSPDLVINDCFYVLERAGPFIYRDSALKETKSFVIGTDPLAVDLITLRSFDADYFKNPVIIEAMVKKVGIENFDNINVLGDNVDENTSNIIFPKENLDQIPILNCSVKTGTYCSGCYIQAYHLLNLIKSFMVKDMKYIKYQSILMGYNPPEPDESFNTLLFGDCSIKTTKNYKFQRKKIEKESLSLSDNIKKMIKKDFRPAVKYKIVEKPNSNILELPGCPPDINKSFDLILKYYKKKNVPSLRLYHDLIKQSLEFSKNN